MKALILAAGEGRRMRPLTNKVPKPLLKVGGKALIEYHLERLSRLGIKDVVINVSYMADQLMDVLGDGKRWGLAIVYSREPFPLETGGAIYQAGHLLGKAPFLLINGDVWTDYAFDDLLKRKIPMSGAHLVLVDNPVHHPNGDFAIDQAEQMVPALPSKPSYTYAGFGLYCPALIHRYPRKREVFPLREALNWGMSEQRLSAETYHGRWHDIGTPERLEKLDRELSGELY